ncbi:hypothetical protein ACI77O_12215 [Pseudomonas tritici]|uniref:hypothetical protein n=1 Tax=Pseudomonas tritici TaxID=2745518 RepID=UPI00387ADF05
MRSKDHEFTVGKGLEIKAAKSKYPDLVRLVIPKDHAIEFAQKVLRGNQDARPEDTHLVEVPLFGLLEKVSDK